MSDFKDNENSDIDAEHRDTLMHKQVETEETLTTRFDGIAYSIFGEFFSENRQKFDSIEAKLEQSRIPINTDLYLSRMTLLSTIGSVIGYLLLMPIVFALMIYNVLPPVFPGVIGTLTTLLIIFFFLGILFTGIGWGISYGFLLFRASNRKRSLDRITPFAVTYMYALSRGGMNFVEVLEKLAEADDTYGEVATETESIIRDMEYFSVDLPRALNRGARRTPSAKFEEFLDDLVGIIDSGADLTGFLSDKADDMLRDAEREQRNFLQTLALLGEVNVTAFVAGPLFLIIITVVMSMLGGGAMSQLMGIVYGLLPLMNVVFFILIDTITMDEGDLQATIKTERETKSYEETRDEYEEYAEDGNLVDTILDAKEERSRSEMFRNPLSWLMEEPTRTLLITGPIALLVFVGCIIYFEPSHIINAFLAPDSVPNGETGPVELTSAMLVLPVLIMLFPISLFHEIVSRREKKMLSRLPDALKQLASSNDIGMSLTESLKNVSESTTGRLGDELHEVGNDITWFSDVNSALTAFANRVKLPVVARTVKLITEANQSTGDIADVLSVAAKDVGQRQKLKRERASEMMMYTVVVLISFAVYLFVIAMLESAFLSTIEEIAKQQANNSNAGGGGGQQFNLASLKVDKIRMVFFHSTIIQAFGSGLLAGLLGKNSARSGLKFSVILLSVSTIVFLSI